MAETFKDETHSDGLPTALVDYILSTFKFNF